MIKLSFEAPTSSGLLIEIQNYLAHLAGFNKAIITNGGSEPVQINNQDSRFESSRPIHNTSGGHKPPRTKTPIDTSEKPAGSKPSALSDKRGPGRPKKSREEHLHNIESAPMADQQEPSGTENFESETVDFATNQNLSTQTTDVHEPPVESVTSPPKITKENCVEVLKKVSTLPSGINKVRDIFKKFGVERLGEIDEKRYHELIKVAQQTILGA